MSQLSDKDLAQAAAEAGISPEELKQALSRRDAPHLEAKKTGTSHLKSHASVQATFAVQPSQALANAHRVFSQQVHLHPTRSADGQVSYVSPEAGLSFRLSGQPGEVPDRGLVRVDIDMSKRTRKMLIAFVPLTALFTLIELFSLVIGKGTSLIWFVPMMVIFFFMFIVGKRHILKEAKQSAEALLDRASQNALPR